MPTQSRIKIIYFSVAAAFHSLLVFTDFGNYFHGGTAIELVILQTIAVLLTATAIKIWSKVNATEKIFVILCAVVPTTTVAWSLISMFPSNLI